MKPNNKNRFSAAVYAMFANNIDNELSKEGEKAIDTSELSLDILSLTEHSIASLRIDTSESLSFIDNALSKIILIEDYFQGNEHQKHQTTSILYTSKQLYPMIQLKELSEGNVLPTLKYKIRNQSILRVDNYENINIAYFDYISAKTSLNTAKNALLVDHKLEAIAHLRKVFEAVYLDKQDTVSKFH